MRIAIVVGEHSGDILGSQLITALQQRFPDLSVYGIGGPLMRQLSFHCVFDMEQISVMGLFEVIKHIPRILSIRRRLVHYFQDQPPDLFIGIDAPDFNLPLEKKLKQKGIPTVHYVSPTIWAWRAKRIHSIAKATDLMLTLFPFEVPYYQRHHIPVQYVGHPLADVIPLDDQRARAREQLQLPSNRPIVAIMPGSRSNEIKQLGPLFLQTAQACYAENPDLLFVAPMANQACEQLFSAYVERYAPALPLTIVQQESRTVMAASDVVLLASGTATLEAMLLKRPMVVAYRMATLTYWLAKCLVTVKHIALPNIIAGQELVPEFIQNDASVENCSQAVMQYFTQPQKMKTLIERFCELHQQLRCQASERAADAIAGVIAK